VNLKCKGWARAGKRGKRGGREAPTEGEARKKKEKRKGGGTALKGLHRRIGQRKKGEPPPRSKGGVKKIPDESELR